MNKKTTGIVAYITIIGWLVAFLAGDKEGAKTHLNTGLLLAIVALVNGWVIPWIPVVGGTINTILGIAVLVFSIVGIIYAAQDKGEIPVIGGIKILK